MTKTWCSMVFLVVLSACEGRGNPNVSEGGAGSAEAGVAGSDGAGGSAGEGACDGVRVDHVAGKILDIHGNPPAARAFTVCGSACVRGDMSEDGSFVFDKKYCYRTDGSLPRPVLIYHGVDKDSDLYVDFIPQNVRTVNVTFPAPFYVVPVAEMSSIPLDPSIPQTLTDGMGFELSYGAGDMDPGFAERLAVRAVPKDRWPSLPGVDQLVALYVLHPSEVTFSVPARVKFPNTANLSPGSAVDIEAVGGVIGASPYPGTLGRVAGGHVTADGAFIVSDEGNGLPSASWVGYRVASP